MRLNWGHGLFLTMTVFIVFIVSLSVKLMSQDSSVVYDDYYNRGLHHDQQMAMERRTAPFADSVQVNYSDSKLQLTFPSTTPYPLLDLKIQMYRPSNAGLDQRIGLDQPVNDHSIALSINPLIRGQWEAKITWKDDQDSVYYLSRTLFIE